MPDQAHQSGLSLSAAVQRRRPLMAAAAVVNSRVLRFVGLALHRVVAELDEHGRDVDLDRAHLVAGAAQRGGERKLGSVLDPDHAAGVRIAPIGPDRSRRRRGRRSRSYTGHTFRQAAQRMHRSAWRPVWSRERVCSAVVEQDDVDVCRPVAWR